MGNGTWTYLSDVLGGKTRVGEPSLVVQSLSILWVAIPISHFPFPVSTFSYAYVLSKPIMIKILNGNSFGWVGLAGKPWYESGRELVYCGRLHKRKKLDQSPLCNPYSLVLG
jgi:hypothetical protein